MKKLYLASFLFTTISFAQNKNFIVNDKVINWNLVYNDSANINNLRNKQLLNFTTDSTGFIKKTNFSDRKLQTITAEFNIQKKENRYKITVFNIIVYYDETLKRSFAIPEYLPLEDTFLKSDGTIRKQLVFGYNFTELFNPYLEDLFTVKKQQSTDW
jgi:hypothetical protein